ncbi:MAG: hypothetical protein JO345_12480 [Streptosporangiaceae bacterium]|nr:hypothetical protein [Streptosporangiaceae bacterium]
MVAALGFLVDHTGPAARRVAVVSCSVELAGVLAVGTWSLADCYKSVKI